MIGMEHGAASEAVDLFHKYYGPLYSITWIIVYPLLIYLGQGLWMRYKSRKVSKESVPESNLPIK